jgi:hypothetical protein
MLINKKLTLTLTFFISFMCLIFFYSNVDSFENFFNQIKNASYSFILLAIFLLNITVIIRAFRWNILLPYKVKTYKLYKIQLIGYFLNNILPFKLGEILKSLVLSNETKNSNSDVLSSVVVEKFLDLISLLVFSLICLLISPVVDIGETSLFFLVFIIGMIIILSLVILLLVKYLFQNLKSVDNFFQNLKMMKERLSIQEIILSNIYGTIIWLVYWMNVHLIFKAFDFNIEAYESLLILVVASIINSIPSLPGAVGTFHLGLRSVIEGLNILNINTESLITILHLYGYLSLSLVGLFYFILNDSIGFKSIREQIKL